MKSIITQLRIMLKSLFLRLRVVVTLQLGKDKDRKSSIREESTDEKY